jgi:hypothetical protein
MKGKWPRGLQKQQKKDQPELALPLEEEDEKPKIGGPTKNQLQNYQQTNAKHKKTKNRSRYFRVVKCIPWAKGEWS